ncbi:hypothetical protein SLEP1_g12491 [Rubroshorea leprosula]|uniref:Integrase catalytic domain-containing protein n=1 Tax=Rubroshorea leprosula TaxID=152421 RepID=A0AAV5IMU5_9ROSI|nr:hypothetical protein SLEP1_g12491 [Rubroshorea leprosula]
MVNTRSVRARNPSQPFGQGQLPNNLPPQLPPQIPNMFPLIDHAEGGDENQPPNSTNNSTSTANQDLVTAQLAAMQEYLPPRSISSYTEMASAFDTKFSSRRLIRKTTSELISQSYNKASKSLRSKLESLAQKGMLNEYIQRAEQPRFVREQWPQPQGIRNPPNRQGVGHQQASPPLPPPTRIIHMMTGGLEAEGLSSKQRRLYVREVKHQNRAQKRKIDDTDWKDQPITFTPIDFEGVVRPHNDPMVTSIMINNYQVQRVFVDTGNAPDIMYYHCFESLGLDPALLQHYDGPIYGFNKQPVPVEGVLTMNVAFGSGHTYVTPLVRFVVVNMPSFFNVVIGRPTLTEIRAVVSQSHLCMKFPTLMGIATLRGNQEVARHYYLTSVTKPQKNKDQSIENPPQEIHDNRTRLNPEERAELITFLRANKDVFTWTSVDMTGIPTLVSQHKLSTNPLKKPVAQKWRLFGGERLKVIKEEVEKLLQAGFVRQVDYYEWVADPVLVKKANGKWRMFIDYTNLNQACPKDYYPMPNIDKLVKAASGNERLSLLDAYSGYHQNVGPTYKKMVTIVFQAQIGRNLEVYVDDIVVKSLKAKDHLTDLKETFNNLKKNRMRLNPAKCIFGVESGKFLGFMVSQTRIEVNPEKIKVIAEMEPLKLVKDIQRLTGRVAALHSSKGSGAGALLIGLNGYWSEHALKFNFDAIKNMAEYEALLLGLQLALELKVKAIQVYSDSQLVVYQVNSICEVIDSVMVKYVTLVAELRTVLEDKQEAMRLRKKASRYTLVDGVLYKRSFSLSLLRCLNPYEAEYALWEGHESVCGSHVGARTLAYKVLRQGYYWPNMYKDATHFVQRCPKCQFFAHLTHQLVEELTNLVALWPFAQWGLDLLGPFMKGIGGVTHLIVGVDYFTKWVEARPLSSFTSKKLEDFVFSSIICRYGIPNQIVADNGTQFNCSSFRDFCSSYGIKLQFISVYHLESNGMVASVNKVILEGIKPRLELHKARWADELNNVLWPYKTTS